MSRDYRTQTVNLGREAFPLHSELSIAPTKPDIAWFMCVNAPHGGGETLICDGIPVVPALQPEVRASLDRRSLLYTKWIPAPDLEQWFGTPEPNDELLVKENGIVESLAPTVITVWAVPGMLSVMFGSSGTKVTARARSRSTHASTYPEPAPPAKS